MQYLTSMGAVWKLSDASYRRFLRDVAAGQTWDLNDYGVCITGNLRQVTDIDERQAKEMLEDFKQEIGW